VGLLVFHIILRYFCSRKSLVRATVIIAVIGILIQILLVYFLLYSPLTFLGLPAIIWVGIINGILALITGIILYFLFARSETTEGV
jgi:uncharacterized membrane protein